MMLLREEVEFNYKCTCQLYGDAGTEVRKRKKCDEVAVLRIPLDLPSDPNEI